MRRLALTVLPLLTLSGCFYPAARGRALETRLDQLDATHAQLQTELKQTRDQLDEIGRAHV